MPRSSEHWSGNISTLKKFYDKLFLVFLRLRPEKTRLILNKRFNLTFFYRWVVLIFQKRLRFYVYVIRYVCCIRWRSRLEDFFFAIVSVLNGVRCLCLLERKPLKLLRQLVIQLGNHVGYFANHRALNKTKTRFWKTI
jgi:hypothetical protein